MFRHFVVFANLRVLTSAVKEIKIKAITTSCIGRIMMSLT